jgi:hypothetical protein
MHFLCLSLHGFRFSILMIDCLKQSENTQIKGLSNMRGMRDKSNERLSRSNDPRSGTTIENQYQLALVLGPFMEIGQSQENHIL